MEPSGIVSAKGFSLEYFRFGKGPETLFAFHGFDNDAKDFKIFESDFGERYTLIAVNVFFHGNSKTPTQHAEDILSPDTLNMLFNQLLFKIACTRFSLLGFSLGGRVILSILPEFAHRTDRVLMLAPDGLKISPWYRFITGTFIGKKLFNRVVYHAHIFLLLSKLLFRIKLLGEKQYHFANSNFDTLEKRKKVFNVWMIFRHILPDPESIGKALKKYNLPIDLYFGRRDTIIPESFGWYFRKKSGLKTEIHVLDAGHNLMNERVVKELKPWLEQKN